MTRSWRPVSSYRQRFRRKCTGQWIITSVPTCEVRREIACLECLLVCCVTAKATCHLSICTLSSLAPAGQFADVSFTVSSCRRGFSQTSMAALVTPRRLRPATLYTSFGSASTALHWASGSYRPCSQSLSPKRHLLLAVATHHQDRSKASHLQAVLHNKTDVLASVVETRSAFASQ